MQQHVLYNEGVSVSWTMLYHVCISVDIAQKCAPFLTARSLSSSSPLYTIGTYEIIHI